MCLAVICYYCFFYIYTSSVSIVSVIRLLATYYIFIYLCIDCCSLAETRQIFQWCHAGMQLKHKNYELILYSKLLHESHYIHTYI